jgi:hypothetical protein
MQFELAVQPPLFVAHGPLSTAVHVMPSPVYPTLHAQTTLGPLTVHVASALQPPLLTAQLPVGQAPQSLGHDEQLSVAEQTPSPQCPASGVIVPVSACVPESLPELPLSGGDVPVSGCDVPVSVTPLSTGPHIVPLRQLCCLAASEVSSVLLPPSDEEHPRVPSVRIAAISAHKTNVEREAIPGICMRSSHVRAGADTVPRG